MFDIIVTVIFATSIVLFTLAMLWIVLSDYIELRKET